MSRHTVEVDVLIIGGGVAGLWLLARLHAGGRRALLVERDALGSGQTVASQGIIHGGIKYALTGAASAASRAIADMPGAWRAAMDGRGMIDLGAARVLSERQYLWTTGGALSRLAGVAASKVIRTGVESLKPEARPACFAGASRSIDVYAVEEQVLEPRSVVSALVVAAGGDQAAIVRGEAEVTAEGATVRHAAGEISVRARRVVLSAGAGNAALIERGGLAGEVKMQRRPLHMVMARGVALPTIYGHCVAGALTDKPRVTITSQRQANGTMVWYVGGLIAEVEGVARSEREQVEFAKRELASCVPWVNQSATQWATLRVDRAEGLMPDGSRPDEPVIRTSADGRTVCIWPTKLAFAPLVAERLCAQFEREGMRDDGNSGVLLRDAAWPVPPVTALPWDAEDVAWN